MLLVADVHGAFGALARVAAADEPLLVLGDLLNFIDYRTLDGMIADVCGKEFVARIVELRTAGDYEGAAAVWHEFSEGRADSLRTQYDALVEQAYAATAAALEGAESYVLYGNVDRPDVLRSHLPEGSRYLDGEVVEIEGLSVGMVGGGMQTIDTPGEVSEDDMADKLSRLGEVDVLCTHVPPALRPLSSDVVGGRQKGSVAVLDYLRERRPSFHYFGDIHQPQAMTWRVGPTRCVNVGYFRATGRAYRHGT
ncbi:MAG: metallophosphoesterase [Acidimicrobiia bacterium]|nr:metallophosphoesterase [Acidimicrobiia bacterium]